MSWAKCFFGCAKLKYKQLKIKKLFDVEKKLRKNVGNPEKKYNFTG